MYRSLIKSLLLVAVVSAATVGVYVFRAQHSVDAELQREQQRTAELRQIVQRLTAERRVADVIVTDQQTVAGVVHTTILFVEYGRDGASLPARRFTIEGNMIHLDAMVVKFDGKFVEENDPLRGHSIALFTGLYGDPEQACGCSASRSANYQHRVGRQVAQRDLDRSHGEGELHR